MSLGDDDLPGGTHDLAAAIFGASEVAVFENLYVAYAAEARSVARAILGDADLAADAVHSGFLEMLRYLLAGVRWVEPAEARSMVLRNVRWAALKLRRARQRMEWGYEAGSLDAGSDAAWARAEARALCEEIVGRLSTRDQEALRLRYVLGLSNIQAARHLGVTVASFESRLRRALAAARHVARRTGVLPQVVALTASLRHRLRPSRLRHWTPSLAAMRQGMAAAAAGVAATAVAAWTGQSAGGDGVTATTVPRLTSATAVTARLDAIDSAVMLDAIALPTRTVLVLARGWSCGCLVLFRSLDGGATWASSAGPVTGTSRPVLAVAAGYPGHPAVIVDPGNGGAIQMSPRFGAAFAPTTHPVALAPAVRHAHACGAAAPDRLYCQLSDATTAGEGGSGGLLRVTADRILYFRRLGGILCSTDAGVTWEERCPGG